MQEHKLTLWICFMSTSLKEEKNKSVWWLYLYKTHQNYNFQYREWIKWLTVTIIGSNTWYWVNKSNSTCQRSLNVRALPERLLLYCLHRVAGRTCTPCKFSWVWRQRKLIDLGSPEHEALGVRHCQASPGGPLTILPKHLVRMWPEKKRLCHHMPLSICWKITTALRSL